MFLSPQNFIYPHILYAYKTTHSLVSQLVSIKDNLWILKNNRLKIGYTTLAQCGKAEGGKN